MFAVGQQDQADPDHIDEPECKGPAQHPQQFLFPGSPVGEYKGQPETGDTITQAGIYQLNTSPAVEPEINIGSQVGLVAEDG